MRDVPAPLEAYLDGLGRDSTGTVRHLVTVTPRASLGLQVARWTDHDGDLIVGSDVFYAGGEGTTYPLLEFGTRSEYAGIDVGSLELTLLCGEDALFNGIRLPVAAASRMLDGATVKVERVYMIWSAESLTDDSGTESIIADSGGMLVFPDGSDVDLMQGAMPLFTGVVAEARPTSTTVELDIEDGKAVLNVEIPRGRYTAGCSNILFDNQCGLSKATYTRGFTTEAGCTTTTLETSGSGITAATGYYDLGVLTFNAGTTTVALRGVQRSVRSYTKSGGLTGTFVLDRPLPAVPQQDLDSFEVFPGCDKRLTTCETKWAASNLSRFRGFPHVPRDDEASVIRWWEYIDYQPIGVEGGSGGYVDRGQTPNPGGPEVYGSAIPLIYGRTRVPAKTIWRDFGARAQVVQALCEGPIDGVATIYSRDKATAFPTGILGPVELREGTRPTQTSHTKDTSDRPYPGVATVSQLLEFDGSMVPMVEYEVRGKYSNTGPIGGGDAAVGSILRDLLYTGGPLALDNGVPGQAYYGAAFPWPVTTANGTGGTAASSADRYWSQAGFGLSVVLSERQAALDVLGAICDQVNCEPLWRSSGEILIVPRADQAVGTFTPSTSLRYEFSEADLLGKDERVSVRLSPEDEVTNVTPVVFTERAPEGATGGSPDHTLDYQSATVEDPEPLSMAQLGPRPAGAAQMPWITGRDQALRMARILAQRSVHTRQEIEFRVGAFRYARLEPLDLVTVTDTVYPLTAAAYQIREIEEDVPAGKLTIRAQEWEGGVNHATAHSTQSSDGATTQAPPYSTSARLYEAAASNWTLGANLPGATPDYRAVANAGARVVAVGASLCAWSADAGRSWTSRTIPAGTYNAVLWTGTAFIAVGVSVCATSPDGTTWTSRTIPAGTYYGIAAGGGRVVAVGDSVAASSDDDGASWTSRTIPADVYYAVARDPGDSASAPWAAVGYDGACASSTDGASWTAQTIPAGTYRAVAHGIGGVFAAIGDAVVATSFDGMSWTAQTFPFEAGAIMYGLASNGYLFVAVGSGGVDVEIAATSTDGATWTPRTIAPGGEWQAVTGVVGLREWCAIGPLASYRSAHSDAAP